MGWVELPIKNKKQIFHKFHAPQVQKIPNLAYQIYQTLQIY